MTLWQWLKQWQRDERGVVMIEFAIAAPVMVILVAAVVRIGGFLLERMAVERATTEVAALAAYLPATDPTTAQKDALDRVFTGVGFHPPADDYRLIVQSFSRSGSSYPADWSQPVELGNLAESTRVQSSNALTSPAVQSVMADPSRWLVIESYRRNFRFSLDYFIETPASSYSRRSVPARG